MSDEFGRPLDIANNVVEHGVSLRKAGTKLVYNVQNIAAESVSLVLDPGTAPKKNRRTPKNVTASYEQIEAEYVLSGDAYLLDRIGNLLKK